MSATATSRLVFMKILILQLISDVESNCLHGQMYICDGYKSMFKDMIVLTKESSICSQNCYTSKSCTDTWSSWSRMDKRTNDFNTLERRYRTCHSKTIVELRFPRRIPIRQRIKRGIRKKLQQQKGVPIKTAIMINQSLKKLEDKFVLAIGEKITLSCDTLELEAINKTFPNSKHQWIFNNVDLEIDKKRMKLEGLMFEITHFNASDQGLYACRVHYAPKRRKTIYFATVVSEKVGIPVQIMETKTLKLHCPSSPIGRLFKKSFRTWSLKGKMINGYTSIPAKRRAFERFHNASALKHEGSWVCQVTDPATDRQWDLIRYDVSVTALPLHESEVHKFVMTHPILIATQSLSALLFLVAMYIYFVHEPKQPEKPDTDEEQDETSSETGSTDEKDGNDNAEEMYGNKIDFSEEEDEEMNFGEHNFNHTYVDENFGNGTAFRGDRYGDSISVYKEDENEMNFGEQNFDNYYVDEEFEDCIPFNDDNNGICIEEMWNEESEDSELDFVESTEICSGRRAAPEKKLFNCEFIHGGPLPDDFLAFSMFLNWVLCSLCPFMTYIWDFKYVTETQKRYWIVVLLAIILHLLFYIDAYVHWGKADDRNCIHGHPKMSDEKLEKRFRACNSGMQQIVELQRHNQLKIPSETMNHTERNRTKRFKIKDKLSKIHADIPLPKKLRKLIKAELKNATHVRYNRTVGGTMEITCENEISRQINKFYKKSKAKWLHNNGAMKIIAGRMFFQFGILRIERLEPEDQGTYVCQVEYEPDEFKTVALYTLVTDPGIQVRVKESLDFSVHCPSQSLYHMVKHTNRTWIHNHNVTEYSTSIFNKSSAHFYNANKEMAGNWTCVVFDPIKTVEFDLITYQVHVDPPPSTFEVLYQYFKDNPTICGAIGLPLLCIFLVFLVTIFYFVDKQKEKNKEKLDMFKSKLKDMDLQKPGSEVEPYYDDPDASHQSYRDDPNIVGDYPYRNKDHENPIARLSVKTHTHYGDDYMRNLQNPGVNGSRISYHKNSKAGLHMRTFSQYQDDNVKHSQNPDVDASPKSFHRNSLAGLNIRTHSQYRDDYMNHVQDPDFDGSPKSIHKNSIAGSNMKTLSQYRDDYMLNLQNPDVDASPKSYHDNFIVGSTMRTLSQYRNDYTRRLQNPDFDTSRKSFHKNSIAGSNMRTHSQYRDDYMRRSENTDDNFIAGSNMRTFSEYRNDYMEHLQNPDV